jgi:hypothetical protein
VPVAQMQLALTASDNLKAIMGIYDPSLGQRSNETSGRAINARKTASDTSNFHYIDNLSRAIRNAGEVILDLIPKVYNTARVIRILGPDGKDPKPVQINQPVKQPQMGPDGKPVMETVPGPNGEQMQRLKEIERVFDLTTGKYDLVVKAGPSFATQREEFVALATEIIRAYPAAAPILADLIVKNYDIPEADEIVKRFEALLPQQLQGESPEAQAMKAQLQKLAQMLGEARAKLQAAETDTSIEQGRLKVDEYNAETTRLKALAPKGTGFDEAQMHAVVAASLINILQSPDILDMAASGAPPEQLMAAMAERMGQGGQPPAGEQPMAA